jgi:hypothetical protein
MSAKMVTFGHLTSDTYFKVRRRHEGERNADELRRWQREHSTCPGVGGQHSEQAAELQRSRLHVLLRSEHDD